MLCVFRVKLKWSMDPTKSRAVKSVINKHQSDLADGQYKNEVSKIFSIQKGLANKLTNDEKYKLQEKSLYQWFELRN